MVKKGILIPYTGAPEATEKRHLTQPKRHWRVWEGSEEFSQNCIESICKASKR